MNCRNGDCSQEHWPSMADIQVSTFKFVARIHTEFNVPTLLQNSGKSLDLDK